MLDIPERTETADVLGAELCNATADAIFFDPAAGAEVLDDPGVTCVAPDDEACNVLEAR
jgi:hypothetical protein